MSLLSRVPHLKMLCEHSDNLDELLEETMADKEDGKHKDGTLKLPML